MERKWIHSWWRRARKSRDWLKWKLALHVSIIHTFLERSMPAPITAHRRIHQLMYYSPSFPMPFILLPLANIYSKNEKKDKVSSCQRIPPSLSFTPSLSLSLSVVLITALLHLLHVSNPVDSWTPISFHLFLWLRLPGPWPISRDNSFHNYRAPVRQLQASPVHTVFLSVSLVSFSLNSKYFNGVLASHLPAIQLEMTVGWLAPSNCDLIESLDTSTLIDSNVALSPVKYLNG